MPKPSILLVGLPVPPGVELPPVKVAWSDKPIDVTQEIKDVVPLMRERGYEDYEYMGCAPNELSTKLQERITSKTWDAVVVGGGYKGIPDMTLGLEDLVNIVKDNSPSTRVMFLNKGPMSLLETADRLEAYLAKK